MELVFRTSSEARKLAAVWDLFGRPDSPARMLDPRFFGNDFSVSALIYDEMRKASAIPNGLEDVWLRFLNNDKAARETDTTETLRRLVSSLNPLTESGNVNRLESDAERLSSLLHDREAELNEWLDRIFGFSLPQRVDVVLDYAVAGNSGGTALLHEPVILLLRITGDIRGYAGVFIHELLHALVNRSGMIEEAGSPFEEALLDYFSPMGLLDWKVGLIKAVDLDDLQRRNSKGRPYAAKESDALLAIMKEYQRECGEKTIWDFLQDKGFPVKPTKRSGN